MKNKKPLLIATLGYPGSGKTYFSERLAREFGFFHINADHIRGEMFDTPAFTPEEHRRVFHFVDWLAAELLAKGMSVIVDANTNRRAQRKKFHDLAEKTHATFLLIYVNTPLETAEKRLRLRGSGNVEDRRLYKKVDPAVLHAMKKRIEYPGKEEKVLVLPGLEPYAEQIKIFKKWLVENSHHRNGHKKRN